MQPSVAAELGAMRASLERVVSDVEAAEVAASLNEVIRSLRRLERSWPRILPSLLSENTATRQLLAELAPRLEGDLAQEVSAASGSPDDEPCVDVVRANDANAGLRDLLVRVIDALPDDRAGVAAAEQIRVHLLATISQRPW